MREDVIEVLVIIAGVLTVFIWLWVLFYFILVGVDAMLGRLVLSVTVLTVVSVYCMKKELKC